ncbi:MAG: hypothetical protein U9N76_04420 [Candidatus Marinimicrobia bacterium]|nr:hypothetical protein [Candidatus Neomarinimicrobiota bacterium]
MKKMFSFLLISLLVTFSIALYAQNIDATLGGNTSSEGFFIMNSNGDTLLVSKGDGKVGVGATVLNTNFEIYENNTDTLPAMLIEQDGVGDASENFRLTNDQNFSVGIDNDDNDNFKISNTSNLTGTNYLDPNTMSRIHVENPVAGITDFNHQSRARAYLDEPAQSILSATWTGVEFNVLSYNEHGELIPSIVPGQAATFTALEDGYYQVNSRIEFNFESISGVATYPSYTSIAIYKNGVVYSYGNNLQTSTTVPSEIELSLNNAPNVSDVLHLLAGDIITIYVYQDYGSVSADLKTGSAVTYVSIHKIS